MEKVLIELVVPANLAGATLLAQAKERLPSVQIDGDYQPVQMDPSPEDTALLGEGEKVVVIRGSIAPEDRDSLKGQPGVLHVWSDARVEPF